MRTRGIEETDSPHAVLDPDEAVAFEAIMASPPDPNQALSRLVAVEAALEP